MAPTVSVLTPVFNGGRYLDECIRSVVAQTFRDFEYLIVDNRSTDDSVEVAQRWAAQDPRIRVLRPDAFVDVHQNHNRAVNAADPGCRFVKFVHADDWLYPECLERMIAAAEAHPSAGMVSSYRLEGSKVLHDRMFEPGQTSMPGREALQRSLLGDAWVTGSPTSLLFRAEVARRPQGFLDAGVWHSDTDAAYRILTAHDLAFVHQVLTFTRLHEHALTAFSHRVNSYLAHHGRMLIRYGPVALDAAAYRRAVLGWLRSYAWYLGKQLARPGRWTQQEFHRFHRAQIDRMLEEAGPLPALRLGLAACRAMVRRLPT